jgi:hypothetical protein
MIRSRDLVIFVAVLLFLCVGILVTHLKATYFPLFSGAPVVFNLREDATTTFSVTASNRETNREETEVVSIATEVPNATSSSLQVLTCDTTEDSASVMSLWPRSSVTIVVQDGVRSVVYESESSAVASSTATTSLLQPPAVVTKTLVRMEMYPNKQPSATCVAGDIIGVTISGALLSNSDAQFYRQSSVDQLLGYAKDGFPVYGLYAGEVDSCGGYMHPEGYRYTIREGSSFILGCYAGIPSVFDLEPIL